MNESCNVWLKKCNWCTERIQEHLDNIELVCDEVFPINKNTINKALILKDRYSYSYYDCIMLASALDGNCNVIFTEDMSDGQIINDTLKIVNPFRDA
jgi:predicted nucleic acid-binding protein